MRRFIPPILGVLALSLLLLGCTQEVLEKPVNPRLAKSGKQLTEEAEIALAADSSEAITEEHKPSGIAPVGDAK